MHLLLAQKGTLSDAEEAIDLGQSPADMLFLSAADTEIACLSAAKAVLGQGLPQLRLANLMQLSHPMSVDTYIDRTVQYAKIIVVRVIGGEAYWPYGLQMFHSTALEHNIALVVIPGDDKWDENLERFSTVPREHSYALWQYLLEGGAENAQQFLNYMAFLIGRDEKPLSARPLMKAGLWWPEGSNRSDDLLARFKADGRPVVAICFYRALVQSGQLKPVQALIEALDCQGMQALPIFVSSLKDPLSCKVVSEIFNHCPPDIVLNATGFAVSTGLDDREATILEYKDAMVLQVIFSGQDEASWSQSTQGLSARDLAMNVALPEIDGRVMTRAVSFKIADHYDEETQCNIVFYQPLVDRIDYVAALAANWVRLKKKPRHERHVALVIANYPGGDGRLGHGVGLDTPASTLLALQEMQQAGYNIEDLPIDGDTLIHLLARGPTNEGMQGRIVREALSLNDYRCLFEKLPKEIQAEVLAHWGDPGQDAYVRDDAFALPVMRFGKIVVAIQPERAYGMDAKQVYHAADIVPSHHYLSFYFWLRYVYAADAVVHMGKHGNLEWLPGKALALSARCYPEIALGPLPHIYPFIVNDPGEGTQAKRRSSAVIIDHLTPPLTRAESYGPLKDLEVLVDEYYQASGVDPRRLVKLKEEILQLVHITGLDRDADIHAHDDGDMALQKLDAYLCDLKELQIRDGLHIFGCNPQDEQLDNLLVALARVPRGEGGQGSLHRAIADDLKLGFDPLDCDFSIPYKGLKPEFLASVSDSPWRSLGDTVERIELAALKFVQEYFVVEEKMSQTKAVLDNVKAEIKPALLACGPREIKAFLRALDGCFIAPGPSGAPTRGRLDVLPTGRNFFSIDNRSVPTSSAWDLGRRSADLLITRYVQDNGMWPTSFGLTAWGTSNMRTGGDDIAQALALIGVKPLWDHASRRVTGYEIIPLAELKRPRVDVTLRVSGFFRDAFPEQILLFDQAVRAVGALDELVEDNPIGHRMRHDYAVLRSEGVSDDEARIKAGYRIFGARPGAYGTGVQQLIDRGDWQDDDDLAQAWIANSSYAYGKSAGEAGNILPQRLADIEGVIQNQDNREHDLLDSGEYYAFEGGMATAIRKVSDRQPEIYHNDLSRPERPLIQTLRHEIGRTLRARAVNPKWITSAMRHGYKGGVEMAATVDYLFAFAATTRAVENHHFEVLYDAYLGDENVRAFLQQTNPAALREIAQRLQEAVRRKLWNPRSNAAQFDLEQIIEGKNNDTKS